jgi:hypothetical protein
VTRYLFDTTVLIDVLRGRSAGDRVRRLRAGGEDVPYVCVINVEELIRGLRSGEEDNINRLLDGLRLAPVARAEAERAGTWRRAFGERGVTLSQADCLIAAAAHGVGATLVTGNPKDFPMDEVVVEHWPVGE